MVVCGVHTCGWNVSDDLMMIMIRDERWSGLTFFGGMIIGWGSSGKRRSWACQGLADENVNVPVILCV